MKSITKLFIACSFIVFILFIWNEWADLSIHKKINADKVSAFFTALGSLLTAVTVFLLYKQIKEQVEDRKAASRPDLYPTETSFTVKEWIWEGDPNITYPLFIDKTINNSDGHNPKLQLHNIGLGAAKEIKVTWHFKDDEVKKEIADIYHNPWTEYLTSSQYGFIIANNSISIFLPKQFLYSFGKLAKRNDETKNRFLALELTYKDISGHSYLKYFIGGMNLEHDNLWVFLQPHHEIPDSLINKI
jgi:hypothetical protein